MSRYIKTIEAYRLGEGEKPKWLEKALKQGIVQFERQNMIDMETFKKCENAIVGIKRPIERKVYDIDSYIVYDSFKDLIKIVDAYDFAPEGFIKVEEDQKLDKATLIDFFISSVDKEQEPVWTEEYIEELLDNFDVIPKEDQR